MTVTRSLTTAVALACVFVLSVCLVIAYGISQQMERVRVEPVFETMDRIELEDARTAFERGGVPAMRAYLGRLNEEFGGNHMLLDSAGRDLDGGADHVDLLPPAPLTRTRGQKNRQYALAQRSDDGRYWFVATTVLSPDTRYFVGFYLLATGIVLSLGLLCAGYIVLPLRKMAGAVERFGMGDMSARIRIRRADEIGTLAKSYDVMADRLEAAFKRERRLLQDVSHELRAPLTRLRFATNLAQTGQDQESALDEIKRDLDRLSYLVAELTTLSTGPLGGEGLAAPNELVDLEGIVMASVQDCELEAGAKQCSIACTGSASELIAGGPEPLRRAVDNVLRNAVRHSPQGGRIDVELQQTAEWSSLSVRDFGPGVPEQLLERIFEPFFQVDPARSAAQDGLGLGLCIAKRSVEMHHGSIAAENGRPGLRILLKLPSGDRCFERARAADEERESRLPASDVQIR